MRTTEFYKVYGATERQDRMVAISDKNYLLIYGFGKDSESSDIGYNWRKYYDYKPSAAAIKNDLVALINAIVDNKILNDYVWLGKNVYLSIENQLNFKAAYDIAIQSDGSNLPMTFKLGEDSEGEPIYHTFQDVQSLRDFYLGAVDFVSKTIAEGWKEKDSIDYNMLEIK